MTGKQKLNIKRPVFLTGFMGSGKSIIGSRLSSGLRVPFIDLDSLIAREAGSTLSYLFQQRGEAYFRQLESEAIRRIPASGLKIVALGGGAFISPQNRAQIFQKGIAVYMKWPFESLYDRISRNNKRPIAREKSKSQLRALFEEREPFYQKANIVCDLKSESIFASVQKILQQLTEQSG